MRRRFLSGLTIALLLGVPPMAFAAAPAAKHGAAKGGAVKGGAAKGGAAKPASSKQKQAAPVPTATSSPVVPTVPATGGLGSGVSPVSPVPTTTSTTPTVITNSSTTGGSTLSSGSAFGIAAGAVVILTGISFFIWRDARRRAPTRARAADAKAAAERIPGSKRVKPRKLSAAEKRRRKRGRARR